MTARVSRTRALLGAALLVTVPGGLLVAGCVSGRFDGPDGDRRLYEARCGLCHVPWAPGDYPPGAWPSIVEEMGPRAGLDRALRERVTRYLVRAASGDQDAELSGIPGPRGP